MFYWPPCAPENRVSSDKPWPASCQIYSCPLSGFFFIIWASIFSIFTHLNIVCTERGEGSSPDRKINKYMEEKHRLCLNTDRRKSKLFILYLRIHYGFVYRYRDIGRESPSSSPA